jgi:amidophosphoribosyltransferase
VQALIGADWLLFQDLEDLIASCAEGSDEAMDFECSVFDGKYVTGDVSSAYLGKLEARRNDLAKRKDSKDDDAQGDSNEDDCHLHLHSNS